LHDITVGVTASLDFALSINIWLNNVSPTKIPDSTQHQRSNNLLLLEAGFTGGRDGVASKGNSQIP
jgi:hypothetical protein